MPDKIQGNNDKERLLFIAKTYQAVKKIPASEIASASNDGQTVITVQGTKVTDALLREALNEEAARAAAARAAFGIPADVVTKDEAKAMIEEAVRAALAEKQPPPK